MSQSAGQSVLWPPQLPLLSQIPRRLQRSRRLSSESRSRRTRRLLRLLEEARRLRLLSVARYPRLPREMVVFLGGRSQCAPRLAESSSRVPCRGLCQYLGLRPGEFHHVRRKSHLPRNTIFLVAHALGLHPVQHPHSLNPPCTVAVNRCTRHPGECLLNLSFLKSRIIRLYIPRSRCIAALHPVQCPLNLSFLTSRNVVLYRPQSLRTIMPKCRSRHPVQGLLDLNFPRSRITHHYLLRYPCTITCNYHIERLEKFLLCSWRNAKTPHHLHPHLIELQSNVNTPQIRPYHIN